MTKGNFYPPEGPEWLPTQEIRDLADANSKLLETNYYDRMSSIRADVILQLMSLGISAGNEMTWALFAIDNVEEEGSVASLGHMSTEGAIIINPSTATRKAGSVRCIRRELVNAEHGPFFIIEDMMIDEDGGATYMIDAMMMAMDDESGKMLLDASKSLVPFYYVDGDELNMANYSPYPRVIPVESLIKRPSMPTVTPFGSYEDTYDMTFALDKIEGFLRDVTDKPPYMTSRGC